MLKISEAFVSPTGTQQTHECGCCYADILHLYGQSSAVTVSERSGDKKGLPGGMRRETCCDFVTKGSRLLLNKCKCNNRQQQRQSQYM